MRFFGSWSDIGRAALFSVIAYVALVVFVRLAGKRTLSNINIVDLIVTVAVGNVLAMTALSESVSLVQGTLTLGILIGVEYASDWAAVRWPFLRNAMFSRPVLVFYRGRFLHDEMLRERITEEDVRSAARRDRLSALEEVEAVVLEPAGHLTIIPRSGHRTDLLEGVVGARDVAAKPE